MNLSPPRLKTTAKKGNPRDASRGAAAARDRAELGDLLDQYLDLEAVSQDQLRIEALSAITGIPLSRERIESASIAEIAEWKRLVKEKVVP